jgi:hypothetical protein
LRAAIAARRGYCSWDVDHAGWVVTLHSPEEQNVAGKTLQETLTWCLVKLILPELGVRGTDGTQYAVAGPSVTQVDADRRGATMAVATVGGGTPVLDVAARR